MQARGTFGELLGVGTAACQFHQAGNDVRRERPHMLKKRSTDTLNCSPQRPFSSPNLARGLRPEAFMISSISPQAKMEPSQSGE
eukprot:3891340-Pleurochrysis_carterae.AAC.2